MARVRIAAGIGIALVVTVIGWRWSDTSESYHAATGGASPTARWALRVPRDKTRPEPANHPGIVAVSTEVVISQRPVDLSSVINRTHFAFLKVREGYLGGSETYGASARLDTFAVSPKVRIPPFLTELSGHDLRFSDTAILRGSDEKRLIDFTGAPDGSLEASLGEGVKERIENTSSGLEQSWRFSEAPRGDGDLVISTKVDGEEFVVATETGLHFRDPTTGLGVLYGLATWTDANGQTAAIDTSFHDGAIEIRIPSDVLMRSSYPAVLDPTVSPEFDVDAPINGPAADLNVAPAIGHSGDINDEYLVVWQDRRRALDLTYDIFGAHVDRNGNVLDPVGGLISAIDGVGNQTSPRVAFDAITRKYRVIFQTDEFSGVPPQMMWVDVPVNSFPTTAPQLVLSGADPNGTLLPDIAWNSNASVLASRPPDALRAVFGRTG